MNKQAVRFGAIGVLNTGIDFGILFTLTVLGWGPVLSNTISTGIALAVSFVLNRRFAFESSQDPRKQIVPFLAVTLAGLWVLQPVVILLVMSGLESMNPNGSLLVAKVLATEISMIWNFFMYRHFVFPSQPAN